ncbi:MAG: ribbon-helix-helix domain-containing protein [Proteobacteria bacterium]|nr:ribbon-helix-helix domain-containing protein [Pseudomonadota bacterium]
MAKKVTTTVYITEEQNIKLKELHNKTKVPVAEYIREGINLVLERYKNEISGQMTFEDLIKSNKE